MNLLIFGFPKRQLKQRTTLHNVLVFYCCDETSRHHKYGNPCKTKHLTGACLQLQRLRTLLSQDEYGSTQNSVGKEAESSAYRLAGSRERDIDPGLNIESLKGLPRLHSSSKKVVCPNLFKLSYSMSLPHMVTVFITV